MKSTDAQCPECSSVVVENVADCAVCKTSLHWCAACRCPTHDDSRFCPKCGTGRPEAPPSSNADAIDVITIPSLRQAQAAHEFNENEIVSKTDSLAEGDSACAIYASVSRSSVVRCGEQSIVQLEVYGLWTDEIAVFASIESGFARFEEEVFLVNGDAYKFRPIRFVPGTPGLETLMIRIEARSKVGIPLGRWVGQIQLDVKHPIQNDTIHVYNTQGGDVVHFGGPQAIPPIADVGQSLTVEPLSLECDTIYARRVVRSCPAAMNSQPDFEPAFRNAVHRPQLGVIQILDGDREIRRSYAFACSRSTAFGRGGMKKPDWLIRPSPYNVDEHKRISGQHFSVHLSNNRAWITDESANGIWLNGERLPRRRSEILSEGDLVSLLPEQLVPLRVELVADGVTVAAICLRRMDNFEGSLVYVLTSGVLPIRGLRNNLHWLRFRVPEREPYLRTDNQSFSRLVENDVVYLDADSFCTWRSWSWPRTEATAFSLFDDRSPSAAESDTSN